ncbi:MAG: hypothetical protein ACLQAT_18585 [Candidatus Binataceae bacterium]
MKRQARRESAAGFFIGLGVLASVRRGRAGTAAHPLRIAWMVRHERRERRLSLVRQRAIGRAPIAAAFDRRHPAGIGGGGSVELTEESMSGRMM